MFYQYPHLAIRRAKERLYNFGQKVDQKTWQSVSAPDSFLEVINYDLEFQIPETIKELIQEVKPNLPWAEDHFMERIGGSPLNPPPSEKYWPFNKNKANDRWKEQEKFSHTYPERFWPKHVGDEREQTGTIYGIRFPYGDYKDVINQLYNDNTTRQAYLPIWFPEDTGAVAGQRVPCSLGYHFIIRNGHLHLFYFIRSCDAIRHLHNDIYLACRLVFDIIDTFEIRGNSLIKPGIFSMKIISLHTFYKERFLLKEAENDK